MAKQVVAKKEATPKGFKPLATDIKTAPDRMKKILATLRTSYPDAKCALVHKNPLELLVATVLSAQCTDERVNIVTQTLFQKYRKAEDYAAVEPEELQEDIHSTGFYKNKAKNIQGACRLMISEHQGKVPDTMEALVRLPGVGRKTANVILGNAYGIPGITTDTHVIRLSRLMGLSKNSDPVKLEYDLMALVPQKEWTNFSHQIIYHGRRVCNARKPDCDHCSVRAMCCYGRH